MSAPLYQQIMSVPGLTGTWKQRLAQYYKALTGKTYGGSLNEGLYMLNQIKAQNFPQAPAAPAATPPPVIDPGAQQGQQAGEAQPINFNEVLPWEQYFTPELAQGSAEQAYAAYFAPIAQQRQTELESGFANRNLTRSGLRGQSLGDLYRELGTQQQQGIESDVMQQRAWAQEDYGRMQELYESSSGKQKPASTQYTPYKVERPKTDAGTYGSSYLDWLNRATRV